MSKESALRAMREARYAERNARGGETYGASQRAARPARPAAVRPAPAAAADQSDGADEAAEADALCGHRSMNGRTCTREQGHDAKNHRYS